MFLEEESMQLRHERGFCKKLKVLLYLNGQERWSGLVSRGHSCGVENAQIGSCDLCQPKGDGEILMGFA